MYHFYLHHIVYKLTWNEAFIEGHKKQGKTSTWFVPAKLCACQCGKSWNYYTFSSLSFPFFLLPVLLFIAFIVTHFQFDPDLSKGDIFLSGYFAQWISFFQIKWFVKNNIWKNYSLVWIIHFWGFCYWIRKNNHIHWIRISN